MPTVLIVAYGNPLRRDDGIAWRAADELENRFPKSDVEIIRLHQLAPEVADAVRNRDLVIFLDAACVDDARNDEPGKICTREISGLEVGAPLTVQFSHVYSPEKVLYLARQLYQAAPKAFVVTLTGEDFGHGNELSDPVRAALPVLVTKLEQIVGAHLSKS